MNWETEQVWHLVSGNFDSGDYEYWEERADLIREEVSGKQAQIRTLADELEDTITEAIPDGATEGLFGSFIKGALSEVDWKDVAEGVLEE